MKRFLLLSVLGIATCAQEIRASATLTQVITANVVPSVEVEPADGGVEATIPTTRTVEPDGTILIVPEEV